MKILVMRCPDCERTESLPPVNSGAEALRIIDNSGWDMLPGGAAGTVVATCPDCQQDDGCDYE